MPSLPTYAANRPIRRFNMPVIASQFLDEQSRTTGSSGTSSANTIESGSLALIPGALLCMEDEGASRLIQANTGLSSIQNSNSGSIFPRERPIDNPRFVSEDRFRSQDNSHRLKESPTQNPPKTGILPYDFSGTSIFACSTPTTGAFRSRSNNCHLPKKAVL